MNGNRGAKGSVNDRIISLLYRKKYLEYLKKKESYTAEERKKAEDYLKKLQTFDIETNVSILDEEDKKVLNDTFANISLEDIKPNPSSKVEEIKQIGEKSHEIENVQTISSTDINELIYMGDKVVEFDPMTEMYDFDNYDYYEVLTQKTGLNDIKDDEIVDVEKEIDKREDESIILEEVTNFIDESKKLLSEIKFEINSIKAEIDEQKTQEQIAKLDERYTCIQEKLNDLKKKYLVMKEKYNFDDYEILDNITLIETIENYKTKAKLDELESLVDACKDEVEAIDGVLIEDRKSVGVGEEIVEKKDEIIDRDNAFENTKDKAIYLDDLEKTIQKEAEEQRKIIRELEIKIAKVEHEVVKTTEYVYQSGRMFSSFLRIATGILTAPLSNTRLFGVMLGTHLINRGLKDLKSSLIPKEIEKTEVRERYQNVEREILNTKDEVGTTLKLLDDSLEQIEELQEIFKIKFEPYASYIPEYHNVKNMLDDLQKKLQTKKEQMNTMNKTLDKQYEKNKQKVLKAS